MVILIVAGIVFIGKSTEHFCDYLTVNNIIAISIIIIFCLLQEVEVPEKVDIIVSEWMVRAVPLHDQKSSTQRKNIQILLASQFNSCMTKHLSDVNLLLFRVIVYCMNRC